jgi:hypothetical protein
MSAKDGLNDNEIRKGSQEDSGCVLTDSYKILILWEAKTGFRAGSPKIYPARLSNSDFAIAPKAVRLSIPAR